MDGPLMETDVRTGRLVDWSARGVPADVQVYEHEGIIALYKEFGGNASRHVAMRAPISDYELEIALRTLNLKIGR